MLSEVQAIWVPGSLLVRTKNFRFAGTLHICRRSLCMNRLVRSVILIGLFATATRTVSADPFQLQLTSVPPVQIGSEWEYTYELTISSNERFKSNINPILGNFVTIFDFVGYVSGSILAPAGWTATAPLLGTGAPQEIGSPGDTDNPNVPNLVFTYTDASPWIGASSILFTAKSIYGPGLSLGQYLSKFQKKPISTKPIFLGATDSGPIALPAAVPEVGNLTSVLIVTLPIGLFFAASFRVQRQRCRNSVVNLG